MNELITLEQAVKLSSRFDDISARLDEKKARVEAMLVSEENRKDAKAIRAELNKESKAYADDFKGIKAAVLNPWNEVEAEYKSKIVSKYAEMDRLLKSKIDEIEDGLKSEKEAELMEFFKEYRFAYGVDFVESLADMGIKVGLSDSLSSLKKKVRDGIDAIRADIDAIGDNAEVLAEYQSNGYKLSFAIQTVGERKQAIRIADEARIKREREAEEEKNRIAEMEHEATEKSETAEPGVEAPKAVVEEKTYATVFEVRGTIKQLKALKQYLEENELEYMQR